MRNNYPLYVSVLNSPSFLKWEILNSLIRPLWEACSVFHLLFSAVWPHFKRSIHDLPYFHSFSFFSHSFIRPNLSPVRYTVFLWISTHALRSALRRISTRPQAPPQTPPPSPRLFPSFPQLVGIQRKSLSFSTLSIIFQASTAAESEQEINKRPLRLSAILPISAFPPPLLWPTF